MTDAAQVEGAEAYGLWDAWAILYADGELVLQRDPTPESGRRVIRSDRMSDRPSFACDERIRSVSSRGHIVASGSLELPGEAEQFGLGSAPRLRRLALCCCKQDAHPPTDFH